MAAFRNNARQQALLAHFDAHGYHNTDGTVTTLASLAGEFGLSRERVRQILTEHRNEAYRAAVPERERRAETDTEQSG